MTESDRIWHEDKLRNGWNLPAKSHWLLRLPIIRYFRWFFLNIAVHKAAAQWGSVGIGIRGPNQYDLWVLHAIYKGWC